MRSFLKGFLVSVICLLALIFLARLHAHNATDAQAARGVVERSYMYAMTGDFDELSLCQWKWKAIEGKYGRVRHFRILRECWAWMPYEFEVEVVRERARTREVATALAGPSRAYGYYISPSASDVRVAEAHSRI